MRTDTVPVSRTRPKTECSAEITVQPPVPTPVVDGSSLRDIQGYLAQMTSALATLAASGVPGRATIKPRESRGLYDRRVTGFIATWQEDDDGR